MYSYDNGRFTVLPSAAAAQEQRRRVAAMGVTVLVVDSDQPVRESVWEPRSERRRTLSRAAEVLNRMADYVEQLRRSVERHV